MQAKLSEQQQKPNLSSNDKDSSLKERDSFASLVAVVYPLNL